jgi:CubicO group peptidase (beta-lactamase class C family)
MKDAGMVRSGYPSKTSLPPGTAVGYTPDGRGSVRPNDHELPHKGSSAGGGYASARDWARFAWGLARGKLVSESSRQKMFAIQLLPDPRAPDFGMGLGFVVAHIDGDVMAGHNGGFPGVSTSLQFFLKKGYAIVVLSNRDPADVGTIAKFIADKVPTLP